MVILVDLKQCRLPVYGECVLSFTTVPQCLFTMAGFLYVCCWALYLHKVKSFHLFAWTGHGGGVDPIPCVSTHRISDPRSGPAQLPPHTSSSAATPTGSVHKSHTVSVVGMSGQLKRCNESWFGSLQSGQFAAGWLAGSILCR